MGNRATFVNKNAVLNGETEVLLVDADGDIKLFRTYNVGMRREAEIETLDEVHGRTNVPVRSFVRNERIRISMGRREAANLYGLTLLGGDGRAPEIQQREQLHCRHRIMQVPFDDPETSDPSAFGLDQLVAAVRGHTTADFPAATIGTATASTTGAGALTEVQHWAWAIHITVNHDLGHGHDSDWWTTLANFITKDRFVDWVAHTPSASATDTLAGGENTLTVTWTNGATTGYEPTHTIIVVGTNSSLAHADNKICAVLPFGAATSALITSLGTATFGAAVSDDDFTSIEIGSISSSQRAFAARLIPGTDYGWNTETLLFQRDTGGGLAAGVWVRVTVWEPMTSSGRGSIGGSPVITNYRTLRLHNFSTEDPDPDTRRALGLEIIAYRVNMAKLAHEILTRGDEGFHAADNIELVAELDQSRRKAADYTVFQGEYSELEDFFSNDILPEAA